MPNEKTTIITRDNGHIIEETILENKSKVRVDKTAAADWLNQLTSDVVGIHATQKDLAARDALGDQ